MLVMVGVRTEAHTFRSHVRIGIGSESDCLFAQLNSILEISDSEVSLKYRENCEVLLVLGDGECWDEVEILLVREIRSLDILSVKKLATLTAIFSGYFSCSK